MAGRVLLLAICFSAILYPVQSAAADPALEGQIRAIRQRYAKVERELKQSRQVKRDLPGESAEGGELTGYFKKDSLRKLVAQFFGETGQAREEYYFWEGGLFFVLRTESRYTKPLSGVVKRKTEERFYFADAKLIRWLGVDKKPRVIDAEAETRGRDLLAASRKFSAMVEN